MCICSNRLHAVLKGSCFFMVLNPYGINITVGYRLLQYIPVPCCSFFNCFISCCAVFAKTVLNAYAVSAGWNSNRVRFELWNVNWKSRLFWWSWDMQRVCTLRLNPHVREIDRTYILEYYTGSWSQNCKGCFFLSTVFDYKHCYMLNSALKNVL